MFVAYNTNIPKAPDNPSFDQPIMKANTLAVNTLFNIDHLPFNTNFGGYHTVIHQTTFSNVANFPPNNFNTIQGATSTKVPAANGFGQLISAQVQIGATTDEVLLFESGGGRITQLTAVAAPAGQQFSATSNGYGTFGPFLIQWGVANFGTSTFVVTTPIAFANAILNIQCTWFDKAQQAGLQADTFTTSTFKITNTAGAIPNTKIQWLAIGY